MLTTSRSNEWRKTPLDPLTPHFLNFDSTLPTKPASWPLCLFYIEYMIEGPCPHHNMFIYWGNKISKRWMGVCYATVWSPWLAREWCSLQWKSKLQRKIFLSLFKIDLIVGLVGRWRAGLIPWQMMPKSEEVCN